MFLQEQDTKLAISAECLIELSALIQILKSKAWEVDKIYIRPDSNKRDSAEMLYEDFRQYILICQINSELYWKHLSGVLDFVPSLLLSIEATTSYLNDVDIILDAASPDGDTTFNQGLRKRCKFPEIVSRLELINKYLLALTFFT